MKGYVTSIGYMGLVDDQYLLFCSECDYVEYMTESEGQSENAA